MQKEIAELVPKPGLPLTLGFPPDDALVAFLADAIHQRGISTPIALSIIRQLLYALTDDFAEGVLVDHIAAVAGFQHVYSSCYVTYRPADCRCFVTEYIYFEVDFRSRDLTNYDVVNIELAEESLTRILRPRLFLPTPEERRRTTV